ncbi:putative Glycosyl transferase [Methylocella tundrae]|nr:glycosyltransferase [Methylocella tundrae]VTZ20914.1 putative Glycosyl transferase [Methylocella tundrae]
MTRNLHIVHVTESVRGGTSTYVEELIKDNLEKGYRVSLLGDERLLTAGLKDIGIAKYHYNATRRLLGIFNASRSVTKLLSALAPDIVHLHGTFPGLYVRALRSSSYKVVHCAHGWAFCQDVPWIKKALYAGVERLLSSKTDVTVNISHFEGRAAMKWGLAGDQVVIRNGVAPSRATSKHVIEPRTDRLNLGFIGRFDRQKGLEILLDATAKCQDPAVHLWVAGACDRDRGVQPRMADNVSFVGWLGADRIDDFISDLDAVVIPSRWEGFGLVGIEAMRNGKPLIVSDRGALPEMMIHGFNGLVFNLDDPCGLRRALQCCDRNELRKMGANALAVYHEAFRLEMMLGEINALYERLASAPASTRRGPRGVESLVEGIDS